MPPLLKCDLTIIIPVYNLERFIQPMLDSLKAQKHDYNVEIIFVLNNCTDNSEEVIRESGLGRILYCEKQGCGNARNVGMDEARGEYIWFMDGDDWLLSNTAIKEVLDKAKEENIDVLRIPFKSGSYNWNYFSMVWQYLFKRDFINEFRFPDRQPGEDDEFSEKVLNKTGRDKWNYTSLPRADRPLYFYNYLREGSNMFRYSRGEKI